MAKTSLLTLCAAALAAWVPACGPPARDNAVLARRAALEKQTSTGARAIPELAAALDDPSPIIRRTAARLLLEMGAPARPALMDALGNSDLLVRRTAVKAASGLPPEQALPILSRALADPEPMVRQAALERLVGLRPRTPEAQKLLEAAGKDADDAIRAVAVKALWPFHRDVTPIRERPDYDHDVQIAQVIRLPRDGWRFHLDPGRDGHTRGWFKPTCDDSAWKPFAIEQAWQKAGVKYIGVAWYRRSIDLPPRPDHVAVELLFQGVDECAWVWINGVYVGDHDVGPRGWNEPFRLDVTRELAWGARNQITVRAMNTANAGGIWRPVELEVLK